MAILLDFGRPSLPAQRRQRELRRYSRRRLMVFLAQQRTVRVTHAQNEPTCQTAKSASTWPDSISNYFHPSSNSTSSPRDRAERKGGGNGGPPTDGKSPGGNGDDDAEGPDNEEIPELLTLAQAESLAAEKGAQLPGDFISAAKGSGLRASTLHKFLHLQVIPHDLSHF